MKNKELKKSTNHGNNVYPVLKNEDVPAALKAIFQRKIEVWWHYKEKYVEFEICTSEEFDTQLKIQCEKKSHDTF